jgi:hypothetical protein
MKSVLLLFGALVLLTGCATTDNYLKGLSKWTDSSESQVVDGWGIPTRTHDADGVRYLEYRKEIFTYGGQFAGTCVTTFVLNNGRVFKYSCTDACESY